MKKNIFNSFVLVGMLSVTTISQATVFTCPTLRPDQIYFYMDWIDTAGNTVKGGEWNHDYWRLWINGDSYLTPKDTPVITTALAAHYFASTNSWYLKCTSGDYSIGPRNNVWVYRNCKITANNNGFECH